ncbi:FAD-dependent oxidoreductase [Muricauda sp. JGD-17]|uniref:FAD-dependent oxidoreductase n=1 Tax=Flagellimonas ochracea TaxID=2696472 RepID=A0A964WX75_9FLAO|nr:FAD-dependent oxidoreductase [Allomuricauda ochracea]NAY91765.1 FAD-dependent oxidoreductase [Allomuricauda ochracea]
MELSYWEYKTWLTNVDFTIVGSGIVGLSCALQLKDKYPKSKVLMLERGSLPQGASTKNAGFACFGSISELLSDLKTHSEEEVVQLVTKRWSGIQLLRKNLGDKAIGFEQNGGHELFLEGATELHEACLDKMYEVNQMLASVFKNEPFVVQPNKFKFGHIKNHYITHLFEGQLDTGKMMQALLQKCSRAGISILNGMQVDEVVDLGKKATVRTSNFAFDSKQVIITTNGFAEKLLKTTKVNPARAQVLITKPIKNLQIKGTFHLDEGFYYFRNIDNRILLGGGRNLDFEGEKTTEFGQTQRIQEELEKMLKTIIFPNKEVEIERRWSGIMGVGNQKSPIVRQVSPSIYCGVRLGGMGIALGSLVGKELADLL